MAIDIRADVEQTITQRHGKRPTKAEIDNATEFVTLYLQATPAIQKMVAETLLVTAKMSEQREVD